MDQMQLQLPRIHICQEGVNNVRLYVPEGKSSILPFGESSPDKCLEVGRLSANYIFMHPEQAALAADPEVCAVDVVRIVIPSSEDLGSCGTHFGRSAVPGEQY